MFLWGGSDVAIVDASPTLDELPMSLKRITNRSQLLNPDQLVWLKANLKQV